MLRAVLFVAVLIGPVGCTGPLCWNGMQTRGPHCRPADVCASAPPSTVEVQGCNETVVVKAPPQKVVVETPPQAAVPQAAPQMMYPQAQAMMPMTMGAPFGAPGGMVTATTTPRTRLAFTLDTIRIPIPWIRAVAVPGPQEVTMQIPASQMPMPQPMAFPGPPIFPGQAVAAMPGPFIQGQAVGAFPGAFVQGQAIGAVPAQFVQGQAVASQMVQAQAAPPQNPAASGVTAERVQEFERKIQQLEAQLRAAQGQAAGTAKDPAKCPN
jgi:hypothetical protein